jgi:antitoxin (DNA-binding transcriptional repressor) of toxin-antitoxin stability system
MMNEKSISKSKLKANMLQIFRELEASGETLIVTDHNKPVLKIVPIKEKNPLMRCSLPGGIK